MVNVHYKTFAACLVAAAVSGCGNSSTDTQNSVKDSVSQVSEQISETAQDSGELALAAAKDAVAETTAEANTEKWQTSEELTTAAEQLETDQASVATTAGREIPYPLYPNGSKYRIGGENGLRIVLFQTEDSFQDVDAYFQAQADMPRLGAMPDYVRYSTSAEDVDPWATGKPGIVIHEFSDDSSKSAVGADATARTNIIMSY